LSCRKGDGVVSEIDVVGTGTVTILNVFVEVVVLMIRYDGGSQRNAVGAHVIEVERGELVPIWP
jgi:hypothetical protein